MSSDMDEKISALVDGELTTEETVHLASQLQHDEGARVVWERYHLIGSAFKRNLSDPPVYDLVSRVSQQLATEPSLHVPRPNFVRRGSSYRRPVAGFALAASVAAAVYLGLSWQTQLPQSGLPPTIATSRSPGAGPVAAAPVSYDKVMGGEGDANHRAVMSQLHTYLVNHDELSSMAAEIRRDVLPPVRIVGYEQMEAQDVAPPGR